MSFNRQRANIPECFVFALTADMASADGWVCANWSRTAQLVFRGRLTVVTTADKLSINLVNPDNSVFAKLPVATSTFVERCSDSSRYYVVKVEEKGRTAYLGIGFQSRESSFDFDSSLKAHFEEVAAVNANVKVEVRDFSVKEGQNIKIGGFTRKRASSTANASDAWVQF